MTVDYTNKIVLMDASITDIPVFHKALRDAESTDIGMLYPTIHTYKEVDLGGGALFPAVDFINGWTLQFPAGNYTIAGGNLNAPINPVVGCYVKQTQSAAYAVTASGGSGVTIEQLQAELKKVSNLILAVS
jgi:hypothetical protein